MPVSKGLQSASMENGRIPNANEWKPTSTAVLRPSTRVSGSLPGLFHISGGSHARPTRPLRHDPPPPRALRRLASGGGSGSSVSKRPKGLGPSRSKAASGSKGGGRRQGRLSGLEGTLKHAQQAGDLEEEEEWAPPRRRSGC